MTDDATWPDGRPDLLPPGARVKDTYEVVDLLGEGGFGAVYRAIQHPIGRAVAVKVLMLPGAQMRERFLQEARAASAIRHPNVVTIHDFGFLDEGHPFMVMEFLEGRDLQQELSALGSLHPSRVLALMAPALEALGEGHRQGITHRDLKPANLMLTDPGTDREALVVLDFGVARIIDPDEGDMATGMTASGQTVGTAHYLAPEYVLKQQVSPALDVYQVGLILVEALTGEVVVDGDSWFDCARRHAAGDLPVPTWITDHPALGPLVARSLAADPDARFADGHAFAAAIAVLLAADPDWRGVPASKRSAPVAFAETAPATPASLPPARPRKPTALEGPAAASHSTPPRSTPPRKPTMVEDHDSAPEVTHAPPPPPEPQRRSRLPLVLAVLGVVALVVSVAVGTVVWLVVTPQPAPTMSEAPAPEVATEVAEPPVAPTPAPERPARRLEPDSVDASSTLTSRRRTYAPGLAIDGNDATAWHEAAEGPGQGEWLEVRFDRPVRIERLVFSAGYDHPSHARYGDLFPLNAHLSRAEVRFSGGERRVVDVAEGQREVELEGLEVEATSVRITALELYPGDKWQDWAVSEVEVWGR